MIGETISHYKVLSQLGAGGMGVVYEAEDTRLGRKVAIKFLPDDATADRDAVQRFEREARVVSNLNHPHICTLYDIGSHAGRQFMVMELLDGRPLKELLSRGALPIEEVLELGAQIADGLDAAHAQGVVHRDIKPANLFVTRRGHGKVLDFGVAKLSESGRGDDLGATVGGADQLTTIGTTIGTVAYMSPEQARGEEIDARSDLFSFGVVLYEMATGQLPFQGPTVATIFESLLTRPALPPSQVKPGLPAELDRIVLKALEKDRKLRYQTAADMRADLRRLKRVIESGTAAVAAPPPAARRGWRKPVLIGAPLLTALAIGGVFLYRTVTTPALTQKDSVVLSSVINRTGDAMFDDTLGEALALQLRQSPFLNVVPDQQVAATLRLMGREPNTPITAEVGREICQRAGAKALLGGTIATLGSSYVITLNAQDCVEGRVFAEEQAQAATKESVLGDMGRAVSAFRIKLGESLASIQRYDTRVEEATTPSLEALKAYSQGQRTRRTTSDFDSVPFFRRAIELDPEFALAYARLGTVYSNLGQADESKKMTARAYELREKVSEAERLYIEARYYTTVEANPQRALDTYKVWLATYPSDYIALTNSALLNKQLGDRAEAIRKLELVTKVAPDQPLGFTNLGETYFEMARYADAKRAYEDAIRLSDSTGARVGLYRTAIMIGDSTLADRQVAAVRGRRDEVDMTEARMFAAAYRGRMREAGDLAADFQAREIALSRSAAAGAAVIQLALSEAIVGLDDRASDRMDKAEADGILGDTTVDEQLVVAALLGDARLAKQLLPRAIEARRKADASAPPAKAAEDQHALEALARLADDNPADAAALLEPITFDGSHTDVVSIWTIAKLQVNDWESALKGYQFLTSADSRQGTSAIQPYAYAMLGRVQARLGRTEDARKSYQKFFDIFKDADPDVPLLVQAREEFSKLGS